MANQDPMKSFIEEVVQLPVKDLVRSKYNPRHALPNGSLDDLQASISQQGIIDPLIVRVGEKGFEVLCGDRRFQAAAHLKMEWAPCLVRGYTDDQAHQIALIENVQRETLHPLDEGQAYLDLVRVHGDIDKVVSIAGKSKTHVLKRVQLCQLVPDAKKLMLDKTLSLEAANLLARMQPAIQKEVLKECEDARRFSISFIESCTSTFMTDLSKVPWVDDVDLVAKAGSCKLCPKRTANQPELFSEIKKGDSCLEPQCFKDKFNAFCRAAKAGKKGAVEISRDYGMNELSPKALYPSQWKPAGAIKCHNVLPGFVVRGNDFGKFIDICTNAKCKAHWDSDTTDAERSRRKNEREKKASDRKLKEAIIDSISQTISMRLLTDLDFKLIGACALRGLSFDAHRELCKTLNLNAIKSQHGGKDYSAPLYKMLKNSFAKPLIKFVVQASLQGFPLEGFAGNGGLKDVAKDYKVDVKKLAAEAKEKPIKAPKAKKETAKKKGKGKKKK